MKVEKQLKNDKYNVFEFIKYLSDVEKNNNIIAFIKDEYGTNKINEMVQNQLEYHSMFESIKFDIWLQNNRGKLNKSIVFANIRKINILTKKHINKLRKHSEEIVLEFNSNFTIEEVKKLAEDMNINPIIGYTNYDTPEIRKVIMLLGEKFEYKHVKKDMKILAIIHTYNEEDVIEKTLEYLITQGVDIYVLDNWSTDNTYEKIKNVQEKYNERITISRFPENKPEENSYNWTSQLHKTEEISKELDYDWYIHYDADEIRVAPYKGITLSEFITFVDSMGYNAINTTVLDFRMTEENDDIFAQNSYFEIGRKPTHFMQIKTWKKCNDIELASTGGHLARFENQKVYPLKIINKHYPLRNMKQAQKKIYKDRLPRFEKEKKEKGWHCHYDKIAKDKDFIYDKENLNKYEDNILEKYTLELISGIGINKL